MGALIVGVSCGCSRAPTVTPTAQTPRQTKASVESPQPDTAVERKVFYYPDDEAGIQFTLPRPGQSVELDKPAYRNRWWPELPWRDAANYPIRSSRTDYILFP